MTFIFWAVPAKILRDAAQVAAMREEREQAEAVETAVATAGEAGHLHTLTDAAVKERTA